MTRKHQFTVIVQQERGDVAMTGLDDPGEIGRRRARENAQTMERLQRGVILNQQGFPFSTLSEQDRCIALSAYVREMLEIGRQGKRNCTSRDMKLVLLGQLERALKAHSLKGLVVEKRVNPLLTCYEPLWAGKKINEEIARGINNIFQRTQTNYATDGGINLESKPPLSFSVPSGKTQRGQFTLPRHKARQSLAAF